MYRKGETEGEVTSEPREAGDIEIRQYAAREERDDVEIEIKVWR